MSKRNANAVCAQSGACNPIAVIRGLQQGVEELRAEQPDADHPTILQDPALRLIIHQLAYLFRVHDHTLSSEEYGRLCHKVGMPGS